MKTTPETNPIPSSIEREYKGEYDDIQVVCNICRKTIFSGRGHSMAETHTKIHFNIVHPDVVS